MQQPPKARGLPSRDVPPSRACFAPSPPQGTVPWSLPQGKLRSRHRRHRSARENQQDHQVDLDSGNQPLAGISRQIGLFGSPALHTRTVKSPGASKSSLEALYVHLHAGADRQLFLFAAWGTALCHARPPPPMPPAVCSRSESSSRFTHGHGAPPGPAETRRANPVGETGLSCSFPSSSALSSSSHSWASASPTCAICCRWPPNGGAASFRPPSHPSPSAAS